MEKEEVDRKEPENEHYVPHFIHELILSRDTLARPRLDQEAKTSLRQQQQFASWYISYVRDLLAYPLRSGLLLASAAVLFAIAPGVVNFAAADTSPSSAQLLLQALQSPTSTPIVSTTTTTTTNTQPTIIVPIGISLPSIGTQNAIIPQAAVTTTVATTTATSNSSLLQSLLAELKALEAQIAALEAASSTPAQSTTAALQTFTRNLSLHDQGPDVLALQQFLNAHGYPVATTGPGSPGEETSFFGLATYHALIKFQAASGLPATGYFGLQTRALIAESSASQPNAQAANNTSPATSSSSSATSTPTTSSLIPVSNFPGFGGGGSGGGSAGGGGGGGGGSTDTTPPTVSLTAPSSGATVASSVTLTATASDNVAVASVQFKVDGTNIGSAVTSSPYTTTWSSSGVSDGTHTLYAVAKDTSGNYATSSESVTVENTPISISNISSGTPTTTSATITWTTNEAASSTVAYGTTTSYGSASSSASLITSHSITLTGLSANTTYHYQVQATNAVGSYATSSDQTFTTASNPDTTPPTAPTDLTAVAASLSELDLSWNASNDNGGGDSVTGYKIFRDGSQVGTTTSGTTYADTGLAASSTHTYIVKAYDTAGNVSSASNTATSTTGVWSDGYAGAPSAGNVQYSDFFFSRAPQSGQSYVTRPPWRVAGVDYPVGIPATSFPLKDPSTAALPSGCSYSNNVVTCNGTGNLTIDGYDFSLHNCIFLDIYSYTGTITIKNSNFAMGSSTACQSNYGLFELETSTNGSSLVVTNNVLNGNAQTYPTLTNYFDVWDTNRATGSSLYEYDAFLNGIGRPIETGSNGNWVAQYNYGDGVNYGNATHGEMTLFAGATTTPTNVTINYNTFLEPATYAGGMTTTWYISSGNAAYPVFGTVDLENNTTAINLDGGSSGTVAVSAALAEFAYDPVSTANILNNYIDPTGAYFCYVNSTTITTTNMSGNIDLLNGSNINDFTQASCYGHH